MTERIHIHQETTIPWPAVALAALTWLMSLAYGFQYLVMSSVDKHLTYFRAATVPYLALVFFLTWIAARRAAPSSPSGSEPLWLGLSMMSFSWLLTSYFYSAMIAPVHWLVPAIGIPAIATATGWKAGLRAGSAVFVAAFLTLSIFLVLRVPHDSGGDMLQIIDFAATDFLRGESPFRPYLTSSKTEVPFGYWPGVWLPYVPLIALGIDTRLLNLLLFGLIIWLFHRAAGGGHRATAILAIVLLPFLISPQVLQMVLFGHLWLYWLLVCAALYFAALRRYVAAAILLGLCLATRPTVLFIIAPLAAYVWSREGFKVLLRSGLTALAVVIALNAPFALIYGQDFLANSFGRLVGFGQVLVHFSAAGILQGLGLKALNLPIQALIALAFFVFIFFRRSLPVSQFIMLCGLAYVWEVLFASYATRYIYFPGYLLIALGMAVASNEDIKARDAAAAGQ